MTNLNTKIQWTDATWNIVSGCSKVSPGCTHCYSERLFPRSHSRESVPMEIPPGMGFAPELTRPRKFTDVRLHPERLLHPIHWRRPRKVFVNSMSDLFHEDIPDDFLDDVFSVMSVARTHTFQVLTKRPARALAYLQGYGERLHSGAGVPVHAHAARVAIERGLTPMVWPLPNVWLGVSCEDQQRFDERVPLLLEMPAAVRFISAEPLLGPIDFYRRTFAGWRPGARLGFDWCIVGGESGPAARPCGAEWVRGIRDQCRAAGVACFVKQLGRWVSGDQTGFMIDRAILADGRHWVLPGAQRQKAELLQTATAFGLLDLKGGEPNEWPEDLRVREWPTEKTTTETV